MADMSHAVSSETPSLFTAGTALNPSPAAPAAPAASVAPDNKPGKLAKEFVRWCCGFGTGFRNSPDQTNLRFWLKKVRVKLPAGVEHELLLEARRLFDKKVEQALRSADSAGPQLLDGAPPEPESPESPE